MRTENRARRSMRSKNTWVYLASAALVAFTVFVLLDTFAIARVQQTAQVADFSTVLAQEAQAVEVKTETSEEATEQGVVVVSHKSGVEAASAQASTEHIAVSASEESVSTAALNAEEVSLAGEVVGTYSDENMQISVSQLRVNDTDVYVADVQVSSAEYLKTALAQNAYGRNLKDTTSSMAQQAGAVLAINGDYYGFRDYGYVLRNGVLYRNTAANGTDALVVYGDGTMAAANQDEVSAAQLQESGAWQVFSFGPVLVDGGEIAVDTNTEVGQSMNSNPRTAIGMVSPLHYIVVVSDGRTGDNDGLSLYELAQVMVDSGATFAYNLDGGGSTTMYFQGEVLNNPSSGHRSGERQVSDIVYFG